MNVVHYVLLRLLIQAGKTNAKGRIFLNETIPYTNEMLAVIFNRSLDEIKSSLKLLADLKIIEIDKDNFIRIVNWEKHQNIDGMEKIREQNRKRAERFINKNKVSGNSDEINIDAAGFTSNEPGSKEECSCEDEKNEEKELSDEINNNVTVTMQREKENKKKIKIDRHANNDTAEEMLEYVKKVLEKL